jgi:hypothetical protein
MPRCGHLLSWEQPAQVTSALLGWPVRFTARPQP